jgi:alkanesulfonate monooxygenase SsuD/methylene tetrahydromethanopterin reductase-like flavin-dependent oxidoreductase (luciferase family)
MHTHGLGMRDEERWRLQVFPAAKTRPAKIARLAERFGYHSVWFSDHVLVTRKPGSDSHERCLSGAEPVPNNALQPTASSVRYAPASGSSSCLALT